MGSLPVYLNNSATTTPDQWHDLRIVVDGANMTVWRGLQGEQMTEVLNTTALPAGVQVAEEFLEMNYFTTLKEARQLAAAWKERYNTKRPHSSLKYLPPQTFAERCRAAGSASLRSATPAARQQAEGAKT